MKRSNTRARLFDYISIGLTLAMALLLGSAIYPSWLLKAAAQSANAEADQEFLLPPEVVPVNPLTAGSSSSVPCVSGSVNASTAPGLVSNPDATANTPVGEMQSAQDFRRSLMDSLAGKGNYPQFNGRNPYSNNSSQNNNQVDQNGQPPSQATNQPFVSPGLSPSQLNNQSFATAGQPPLGQQDWTATANQGNSTDNAGPPQTQMLSGPVATPQALYRGGNNYAHGLGAGTSLGATVLSGATNGGAGAYSLGMSGLTLLNYGFQNGLKF